MNTPKWAIAMASLVWKSECLRVSKMPQTLQGRLRVTLDGSFPRRGMLRMA